MGVLPLQFIDGDSVDKYQLNGTENYSFTLDERIIPKQKIFLRVSREDGSEIFIDVILRLDSMVEVEYFLNGGILPLVYKTRIS